VIEVSAVTFPAYEDTEISVRNKKALENAKLALDSAKRSLDSELELAKVKFDALIKVR
jgi:phage head maturation protease